MGARSASRLMGSAALAIALAACVEPNPGVNDVLPPLVVVTGHVQLPPGYQVQDAPAPVGTQVLLGPPGAGRNEAIASGRVVTSDGFYSVSVPSPLLSSSAQEFEIQLLGSGSQVELAAPLALSAMSQGLTQDVTGATTIVAMAAIEAIASGSDPTSWQVSTLAALPQVQAALPALEFLQTAPTGASALASATDPNEQTLATAVSAILQAADASGSL